MRKKLEKEMKNEVIKRKGKKVKGKCKQKQAQQCLSEISLESDEGTTFRNRASKFFWSTSTSTSSKS